jgi:hypothetical protein
VENIWSGRVSSAREGRVSVEIDGSTVEVVGEALPGEEVLVCVRPQDLTLDKQRLAAAGRENNLQARVVRVIPLGVSRRVILDCGTPIVALIPNHSLSTPELGEGELVDVSFKAAAAHLIRKR